MTGRPMKGWIVVAAEGHCEDEDLPGSSAASGTPAPCHPRKPRRRRIGEQVGHLMALLPRSGGIVDLVLGSARSKIVRSGGLASGLTIMRSF